MTRYKIRKTVLEPVSIEWLDYEIRCNSKNCIDGHPRATHAVYWNLSCDCIQTRFACTPCAVRLKKNNDLGFDVLGWRCPYCKVALFFYEADCLVTVEPLP